MKKYLAIMSFFFGSISSALAATVLNFDDLNGQGVLLATQSPNYGGFNWDNNFAVVNDSLYQLYGNTYGSTSGENALFNAYGVTKAVTMNGASFDFIGASFAGWTYKDAAYDYTAPYVIISGFNGSNKVGEISVNLLNNTKSYSWVDVGFKNITKLEFTSSSSSTLNTGNIVANGDKKWWLMDDFTYSPTANVQAVPIPASIWLLGSSMLALFGFNHKKPLPG
ncbi:hypothetical protein [Methylocucumis oryzae]|uniref:PEP-CTERM protein-sorting domain-containing protein n=1 Tax=Methylocucumis oryzae TaxID=1632867 RepID=A0A0F3IM31_9GAMM|nr:hypothetical protein [Methylocucumis oryzae]KJV07727.1 hypothetical protein VZ94_02700 [Methylocucumis oryzae]